MHCRCIRRSNKPTAGTSAWSKSRPSGKLAIGAARDPLPHFDATLPRELRQSPEGSIYEWRSDAIALELGAAHAHDGVALVIDYGHVQQGLGQTLQAVAGHSYTDPLRSPGEADLTAHVDFSTLADSAEIIGGRIHGPLSQRDFLLTGSASRSAPPCSSRKRRPNKTAEIDSAMARLTETGPKGMGELFKVLAIADPKFGVLPGFEK